MQNISTHAFRFNPGQNLNVCIQQLVAEKQIRAGWISFFVGGVTEYSIRFANQPNRCTDTGHFEKVS